MKHWHFDERGGGKTEHLINAVLQRAVENPGSRILVITPVRDLGHRIASEIKDAWIKRRGPEWVVDVDSTGHLELDAGDQTTMVYFAFGTSGSIRGHLGYQLDFIAGDEYQSWEADAYPAYELLCLRSGRPDEYLTISEREES